jgi:glycosyl hydrolase family 44/putative Ig domain-containing protein
VVGYVAKDAPLTQPLTCGYPKSAFPTQDSFDQYDPNCGNGQHNMHQLPGADPTRDGVAIDPSFYSGWLADLKSRYGSAGNGGVALYELGNEPALWNSTHSDMHPAAETAAELWQKSRDLAIAVKSAEPSAKVLGFSDWGWPAYFCSGADTPGSGCGPNGCTSSPDCANHGHEAVVEWLLKQFASYDSSTGERHLDYIDVHYYAQGGSTPDVTRSLWDPSFTDPSWINDTIRLLPRMRQWVATDYPGTKISLSEYNLSVSGDPVTNALIQADALGIFAREGLDLATRWPLGNDGNLIGDAFRIDRNYDGNHSKFGDTWVSSTSSDQGRLAVYGARRGSDGAYTVLVLNKSSGVLSGHLALSGFAAPGAADTWTWHGSGGIVHSAPTSIQSGAIDASFPAMSMTLYVIKPVPVVPPPACGTITVSPASLPPASVGSRYATTITAVGGSAPYVFTVGQPLPSGLSLSRGLLDGVPTGSGGAYRLSISAVDSAGCRGAGSYVLNVAAAPARVRILRAGGLRHGALSVHVAVSVPGRLSGAATSMGVTFAAGSRRVTHAGTFTFELEQTRAGARLLSKDHKLALLITVTLSPRRGRRVSANAHLKVNGSRKRR